MDFKGRDVISIRDFDRPQIEAVLTEAALHEDDHPDLLRGRVMATCFYEPSTRTRLSFEAAMHRLGGRVIGFATAKTSSSAKGESIADTARVMAGYADAIVIRHPLEGAARVAAEAVDVPVINGGDGANQHPTQTFLDLYTIQRACSDLGGIHVGFLGDLRFGRTVHSLAAALAKFGTKMTFVAPPFLRMPRHLVEEFDDLGVPYRELEGVEDVLRDLDVLYVTRIQKERFADPIEYDKVKGAYRIDRALLAGAPDVRIMHPLPRVGEIATDVDALPQALYFAQARHGVTARKALLGMVLGRRLSGPTGGGS